MRRVRKAAIESDVDTEQAAVWVDQLLARFVRSGVLDDERYARALSASLRRRGLSRRNILKKLSEKGIDSSVAEQMLVATDADEHGDEDDIDPEFAAALAYAKRRRLGAFKRRERDRDTDRKDIGALARAGFSYDIARRVLDFEPE